MRELLNRIRNVTDKDKDLPVFSYSSLENYKNCPLQFQKKYIEKKRSKDTSLALELGSLCHYVLEQKGKMIAEGKPIDYDYLNNILFNGVEIADEKTTEPLAGVTQLKRKYFDTWFEPDNASTANYEDKLKTFDIVLHEEMEDHEWTPCYFEKPFEFVWNNKAIFRGFIDRIDTKNGEYRTVDYKTSKKIYAQDKLSTSMQFGIYALAILNEFKKLPVESLYRFILIDDEQTALTKGWEKRLTKALDKLLENIEENKKNNIFIPKSSPLCFYCDFCINNPNATIYKAECDYFSKWTPTNKTFEVNKRWDSLERVKDTGTKRKLIF